MAEKKINSTNFYADNRNSNGFSTISKEGIFKIINDTKDEQEGFRKSCEKLNRPFIIDVYNYCKDKKKEANSKDLWTYYYTKNILLNKNYKDLDYSYSIFESICDDGLPKKDDIDEYLENKKIDSIKQEVIEKEQADKKLLESVNTKIEVKKSNKSEKLIKQEQELDGVELEYLKDKWGEDLSKEQLIWMEKQYKKWEHDYNIDNENDNTVIEQIIFEKWSIKTDRQKNIPVDKRIETLNKLFKLGNFKKRSVDDNEVSAISEYIAEWEKGKPFLKENKTPEFQDPDNFIKLGVILAGAISRTMGKNNQYVEEFENYYKDTTMDLTNLTNNGVVENDKS